MHELQALLDDVRQVLTPLAQRPREETFNIFRLLRQETDEVGLHSRFLASLLDPRGSHGMGDAFLRLFLTTCGIAPGSLHIPTARTLRERYRIDILIRNDQEAIIIENKIRAGDQNRQLERYASIVEGWRLKWQMLYLTPLGHKPSAQSLGKLPTIEGFGERFNCISYQKHIQEWVAECIKLVDGRPALQEVLKQYAQLVKRLTNNAMTEHDRAEMHEVVKLMEVGDNALLAHKLQRNWSHVRWFTERHFWTELLALVETSGYTIAEEKRFTEERLDLCLYEKGDPWYGFVLPLPHLSTQTVVVTLIVERGDRVVKYGIRLTSGEQEAKQRMLLDFERRLADLHCEKQSGWPVKRYAKRHIDFRAFSHAETVSLANPTTRQTVVREFWEELQDFLRAVEARIPRPAANIGPEQEGTN